MQIKSLTLATLFMAYGSEAANCDANHASSLVNELDHFNSMLSGFASLGSSALAAEPTKAKRREGQVTYSPANAQETPYIRHQHHPVQQVQVQQAQPTHYNAQQQQRVASHVTASAQHIQAPKQQQHIQQHTTPLSPQQLLQENIEKQFKSINKQQRKLNALATGGCIPDSHKMHVASQVQDMLTVYIEKYKPIKAAGNLVVVKEKSGSKQRTPGQRAERRQKRELRRRALVERSMAGEQRAEQESDESWSSVPVQYSSEFYTVTTTSRIEIPAQHVDAKGGSDASDANTSDASSDDTSDASSSDSGSSDDETTTGGTNTLFPPPMTQKSDHHNIIYRAIDGAFHLVTGSLHLLESLIGSVLIEGDTKQVSQQPQQSGELAKLMEKAKDLYEKY